MVKPSHSNKELEATETNQLSTTVENESYCTLQDTRRQPNPSQTKSSKPKPPRANPTNPTQPNPTQANQKQARQQKMRAVETRQTLIGHTTPRDTTRYDPKTKNSNEPKNKTKKIKNLPPRRHSAAGARSPSSGRTLRTTTLQRRGK